LSLEKFHATRSFLENGDNRWAKSLGLLTVVTGELIGCTGIGAGLGYLLWKKVGLTVWSEIVLTLLGLTLAFYRIYEISKKEMND